MKLLDSELEFVDLMYEEVEPIRPRITKAVIAAIVLGPLRAGTSIGMIRQLLRRQLKKKDEK